MDSDKNIAIINKDVEEKQSDAVNKLLLEMVKNQKNNMKNFIKTFIVTVICFTILLIAMIVGFFVYESQFEVTEWETYKIEQEAESDSGNAIVNNSGDLRYYGESETSNNNN